MGGSARALRLVGWCEQSGAAMRRAPVLLVLLAAAALAPPRARALTQDADGTHHPSLPPLSVRSARSGACGWPATEAGSRFGHCLRRAHLGCFRFLPEFRPKAGDDSLIRPPVPCARRLHGFRFYSAVLTKRGEIVSAAALVRRQLTSGPPLFFFSG